MPSDATVVCVLTGHGLKDPDNAQKMAGGAESIIEAGATTSSVMKALGW